MYLWMRLSSSGQSWASSSFVIQFNALPCGLRSSAMSWREETPDAVISSRMRRCLCRSVSPLQTGDWGKFYSMARKIRKNKVSDTSVAQEQKMAIQSSIKSIKEGGNQQFCSPVGPGDGAGPGPGEGGRLPPFFSLRYRSQ